MSLIEIGRLKQPGSSTLRGFFPFENFVNYFNNSFMYDCSSSCSMNLLSNFRITVINSRIGISLSLSNFCKPSTNFWKTFSNSIFSLCFLSLLFLDFILGLSSSSYSTSRNFSQLFLHSGFCFNDTRSYGVKATFLKRLYRCWCL